MCKVVELEEPQRLQMASTLFFHLRLIGVGKVSETAHRRNDTWHVWKVVHNPVPHSISMVNGS